MNKSFFIIEYFFIIIFLLTISSVAQSTPPPPDGGSGPGTVDDIPINMYWLLLLLAGVYYGIRNRMKK